MAKVPGSGGVLFKASAPRGAGAWRRYARPEPRSPGKWLKKNRSVLGGFSTRKAIKLSFGSRGSLGHSYAQPLFRAAYGGPEGAELRNFWRFK